MKRLGLLWLLVLSGFAGLSYELLWVRQLALSLGSTTESFATVLAVFFGGLALGSRWAGRRSRTTQRPVATYAALEATTGVLGLVLLPLMSRLSLALVSLEPTSLVGATVFRALLSGLLLLPPTFLMGATLPFICAAVIARDDDSGRGTALVYGLNTLGAVLGAYGVTYWLLPSLGVSGATLVVVGLNLAVAAVAFASSRRPGGDGPAAPPAPEGASPKHDTSGGKEGLALTLTAFLMGFTATGAQLVWSRFFSIALKGTAYGLGAVLVSVLSGIALGSLLATWLARKPERTALSSGIAQLVFILGLSLFGLSAGLVNYAELALLNLNKASATQVHLELLLVFAALLVPTVAAGMGLPLVVATAGRSAREAGAVLARLYSLNTAGCILGSLLVGFVVLPELGTNQTLYVLVMVATLALAVFNLVVVPRRGLAAGLTFAALASVGLYPGFDAREFRVGERMHDDPVTWLGKQTQAVERITFFSEGASSTVMVQRQADESFTLSLNGLGQGSVSPSAPRVLFESTLVAAVPVMHAAQSKQGLLIGLGSGGTARQLLAMGVEHLEVLELEKGVPEAVDLMWGTTSPLKDARLALVVNDARHHLVLNRAKGGAKYDFIASMPSHPWVSSMLFTSEFFELAADNLAPGGVFSTWFGPVGMSPLAIEGLFASFSAAFPHCVVYWVPEASAYYLVGSKTALTLDLAKLTALVTGPAFASEVPERKTPYYLLARAVAANVGAPPVLPGRRSTDDNGLLEFNLGQARVPAEEAMRFFQQRFVPLSNVTGADDAALLELVEHELGTPGGRLPGLPVARPLAREPELARAPQVLAYAKLRVALGRGQLDEARRLMTELSAEPMKHRAALFLAMASPQPEGRAQLEALTFASTEVSLARVVVGLPVDVEPPDDGEVARWLFTTAAQPAEVIERGAKAREVAQRLQRFSSRALYERCLVRAKATGWAELGHLCTAGLESVGSAEASGLLSAALNAIQAGRYRPAATWLAQSHALRPLTNEQLKLFLRAAVRSGDPTLADLAREALLVRGYPPEALPVLAAGDGSGQAGPE